MPVFTLQDVSQRFAGEILGDPSRRISGANSLRGASETDLVFVSDLANLRALSQSRSRACFVSRPLAPELPVESPVSFVVVNDALACFVEMLAEFRPQRSRPSLGISSTAVVSPTAKIGPDTNIYPGAFIGDRAEIGSGCDIYPGVFVGEDCRVGDDCTLHANVVLYPDTVVADRVTLHAGTVLGCDGFGYRLRSGRFEKIPQLGSVRIDADVEIGAVTTVDRGMIGATVIGEGTKLDNHVMIGHNCEIGRHNVFVSQVGLAGSVTTGDYVRCAGQVGIGDHVHLGDGCTLGAKAGVHKDVPAGVEYVGVPAGPAREQFKAVLAVQRLPELRQQVDSLTKAVRALEEQLRLLQERSAVSLAQKDAD
jgi:UDP-3-O-[3-hydroxymyristoyl] glucosamine N-acyltransferase